MTYDEALKMINSTDTYHKNQYGFNSKWKIVPKGKDDYLKYLNDLLNKCIVINNTDVINYSSDSEYAVQSFVCRFLAEEGFR